MTPWSLTDQAPIANRDLSEQKTTALRVQLWAHDHQSATEDMSTETELFPGIQQRVVEPRQSAINKDQDQYKRKA